jgi:hypothetical protein
MAKKDKDKLPTPLPEDEGAIVPTGAGRFAAIRRETSMSSKSKKHSENLMHYGSILADISEVISAARRAGARSVNCIMTAAYWAIDRRIVEFEQGARSGPTMVRMCWSDCRMISQGDLDAALPKATSIRCGPSIWLTKTFSRHRLENPSTSCG